MTIRGLVDSQILASTGLMAIIPAGRWREAGSDMEPPPTPFAEYRWGITSRGVSAESPVRAQTLDVYVHDEPGSYDRKINPAIAALRSTLAGMVGAVGFSASIAGADWLEDSGDAFDSGYRTIVRYSRYRIVGTGI